jgi:hypothetical protein
MATTTTASALKNAPLIDFTSTAPGFKLLPEYGAPLVELIRNPDKRPQAIVVIDRAVSPLAGPAVVRDHLNLTGSSPLLGPNDPCGERFPVVQGIYIEDQLPEWPRVVAVGLKPGVKPDATDLENIKKFGGDVCCYNMVPTMLVAAHARCQVLGILLPEGMPLPQHLLEKITSLVGDRK